MMTLVDENHAHILLRARFPSKVCAANYSGGVAYNTKGYITLITPVQYGMPVRTYTLSVRTASPYFQDYRPVLAPR